jgi:hypothetical protein
MLAMVLILTTALVAFNGLRRPLRESARVATLLLPRACR